MLIYHYFNLISILGHGYFGGQCRVIREFSDHIRLY